MANETLKFDQNSIRVLAGVTDDSNQFITMLRVDPTTKRLKISGTISGGSGTVTSTSVVTANGFAGTVATATTTPAITLTTTITGILKGNGTAISAAVAGDFPTLNQNTTGSAATLTTSRTIGIATGDVTSAGSAFNGSANNTNAYTLATVNSNVGSFGSATAAGTFTVNAKGLITAASSTTITPAIGSITGLGTGVATALAVNVGSAGAFVAFNGALGTPSSGTVTNLTGTASININGTVGATTPTTAAFTTATSLQDIYTQNSITATANAATIPITHRLHKVTNNSAATLTITFTTTSAVDGQLCMVRVYDFSAVAQTLTLVNTENSTVTPPATTNGSTTLPLTLGLQFNSATTKWRVIASA